MRQLRGSAELRDACTPGGWGRSRAIALPIPRLPPVTLAHIARGPCAIGVLSQLANSQPSTSPSRLRHCRSRQTDICVPLIAGAQGWLSRCAPCTRSTTLPFSARCRTPGTTTHKPFAQLVAVDVRSTYPWASVRRPWRVIGPSRGPRLFLWRSRRDPAGNLRP